MGAAAHGKRLGEMSRREVRMVVRHAQGWLDFQQLHEVACGLLVEVGGCRAFQIADVLAGKGVCAPREAAAGLEPCAGAEDAVALSGAWNGRRRGHVAPGPPEEDGALEGRACPVHGRHAVVLAAEYVSDVEQEAVGNVR